VPLSDTYPLTVVFVIGLDAHTGQPAGRPIGTGFLVSVPSESSDGYFLYAVTASHVIASGERTWLRFNRTDGSVADLPVSEWLSSDPIADVAVTPVNPRKGMRSSVVPLDQFLDSHPELEPSLGDDVYFIGLLANMRAMAEENVPMVRSGTLGRMYQNEVPLRRPDDTIFPVTAHLIDCQSFSGFSGSPCFVQFEHRQVGIPDIMIGKTQQTSTLLLGLISGHWSDEREARQVGGAFQAGTFKYDVNTGVGVVTPAESIREALNREELVDMRRKGHEKRKASEAKETVDRAVTLDKADTEATFRKQNFEEALHRATQRTKRPEK
jgi:hypothetical protein